MVSIVKDEGKTGVLGDGESIQPAKRFFPSRFPDWAILVLFGSLFATQAVGKSERGTQLPQR